MKYKLVRQVRLGLAHRSLNGDNAFLHPKYYRQIGKEIYRFAKSANKCNINVMLDCGFVPCMFPESFFLIQNINADNVGQCCGPIPDIMPDGSIIHCYPLAMASNITKVENWDLNEIKRILEKQVSKYRSIGIYDECKSCEYLKSGACVGGCLAMSMNRLSSTVNIGKPLAHQINAIKNNGDFI